MSPNEDTNTCNLVIRINSINFINVRGGIYMKSTGIVRKVDELGRIVLPIELRRTLNIDIKDSIEIYVDNSSIVLKKYEPTCLFCGESEDVATYKDKNICKKCLEELKNV